MIKLLFCLRRLPSLTLAEFHDYWRDQHAPLVRERASILGIRRYVQNHMFADAALQPALDARGSAQPSYDGVAELWFDSREAISSIGADPAARQAGRDLLADERRFIDLANSPIFYTDAHEIIVEDH